MANIKALAARLKQFEDVKKTNEFSRLKWQPKEGLNNIRIVPYKFNPDSPFIELKFYYDLGGKHYLAPCTFGKPDPVQEAVQTLLSSGDEADRLVAKKLTPTTRTYAPIIVRGEEEKGVRFWGFGVQVYKQLLTVMTNAKYGDITSWTDGRDIEVTFKKIGSKKNAQGKPLPETTLLVDPTTCPVVDPSRKDLLEKIKDQTDILNVFPLSSYEDLKKAVEAWIRGESSSSSHSSAGSVSNSDTLAEPDPTQQSVSATPVTENLAGEFESFFNTNTK